MEKIKLVLNKIKLFFISLGGKIKSLCGIIFAWMKKHKILTTVICLVLAVAVFMTVSAISSKNKQKDNSFAIKVERRDIEEKITDSTTVEANDEYSITPMVSGEILDAPFEEGDEVQKGDLLYTVDASTVEKSIQSADISIAKAKKAYDDAVNNDKKTVRDYDTSSSTVRSAEIAVDKAQQAYDDALRARDDLTLKSNHTGSVTKLYVSNGDNITAGSKIADVVDNDMLKIKVPFNTFDIDSINIGDSASLTLTKSGSTVYGTVSEIGTLTESGNGYTSYKKVTIEVSNPGAVSSGDTATAMIGDIACGDVGSFENNTEDTITASSGGKIQDLYIAENDSVYNGQSIIALDSDSVNSQINTTKLSLSDAKQSLERAKISQNSNTSSTDLKNDSLSSTVQTSKMAYDDAVLAKDKLLKQLEDYTITAPISGTVVTKNMKKGDKIGGSSSSSTSSSKASGSSTSSSGSSALAAASSSSALAVIYDMSSLKCTLDVDELDVKKISTGLKVTITADASDKEYTGVVENVSVEGTVGNNGVTTYPVKINIIDFDDDILPGMNIDASIVITSVHNVLSIPAGSINRGNKVYIKGDKTDDTDKAPEGYKTVEVKTGAGDGNYIQILSGLDEGEELYSEAANNANKNTQEKMEEMHNSGMKSAGGPGGGMGGGGM